MVEAPKATAATQNGKSIRSLEIAAAQPPVPTKKVRKSTNVARSRYIPVDVRRNVWERDGGRCAFVGSNGKRCGSRDRLEFHHLEAFALGGEYTEKNCSLRCAAHNQYAARLDFGDELMDLYIRGRSTIRGPAEDNIAKVGRSNDGP